MPEFEKFIDRMNLSIERPIKPAAISRFRPPLFESDFYVRLYLSGGHVFHLGGDGIVETYSGPRDYELDKQYGRWESMRGQVRMNTNEVIAMATNAIVKAGHSLEDATQGWPLKIWGPLGWGDNVFPFFLVKWAQSNGFGETRVCVDADRREIAGMHIDTLRLRTNAANMATAQRIQTTISNQLAQQKSTLTNAVNPPKPVGRPGQ